MKPQLNAKSRHVHRSTSKYPPLSHYTKLDHLPKMFNLSSRVFFYCHIPHMHQTAHRQLFSNNSTHSISLRQTPAEHFPRYGHVDVLLLSAPKWRPAYQSWGEADTVFGMFALDVCVLCVVRGGGYGVRWRAWSRQ